MINFGFIFGIALFNIHGVKSLKGKVSQSKNEAKFYFLIINDAVENF